MPLSDNAVSHTLPLGCCCTCSQLDVNLSHSYNPSRRGRIASDENDEAGKQDIHEKNRDSYDFSDATLSPDPAELLNFDDMIPMPNTPGTRYSYDGYTNPYLDWTIPKEGTAVAPFYLALEAS